MKRTIFITAALLLPTILGITVAFNTPKPVTVVAQAIAPTTVPEFMRMRVISDDDNTISYVDVPLTELFVYKPGDYVWVDPVKHIIVQESIASTIYCRLSMTVHQYEVAQALLHQQCIRIDSEY